MSLLKRIGTILLKATEILSGVGPFVPPQYQKAEQTILSELKSIEAVIVDVEAFGQVLSTPGPDKLRAAMLLVAQVILQSSIVAGRKIALPDIFQRGCGKVADGFADILNSFKDDVDTQSKT